MKKLEAEVGDLMKLPIYLLPLSVVAVLLFVPVAMAQSIPEQGIPDQYSADDQYALGQDIPDQSLQTTNNSLVSVDIEPFGFYRAHMTVDPGTTVKWLNVDTKSHTVTADDGSFDSGELRPGQSYSYTFGDEPGKWTYHSELDPDMTGSIIVGGASGGGDATSEEGSASDPAQGTGDSLQAADNSTPTTNDPTQMDSGSTV